LAENNTTSLLHRR